MWVLWYYVLQVQLCKAKLPLERQTEIMNILLVEKHKVR